MREVKGFLRRLSVNVTICGTFAASIVYAQVYPVKPLIVQGNISYGPRLLLSAISDDPKAIVLALDTSGVITIGTVVTGMDFERLILQQSPGGSALVHTGAFIRQKNSDSSEIYLHASVLATGNDTTTSNFLNSSGLAERLLMARLTAALKQNPQIPYTRNTRTFYISPETFWNKIDSLNDQGKVRLRFSNRTFGVATFCVEGKQLTSVYDDENVIVASLFVEAISNSETQVKVHAVSLTNDCSIRTSTKLVPEVALLDMIAFANTTSVNRDTAETMRISPHGFCNLLLKRQDFSSLDTLRAKAGKRSFAKDAEQVWAAVMLILRQYAVVTISNKSQWRISYIYPCKLKQENDSSNSNQGQSDKPQGACTVSIWLEPKGFGTDTFVAVETGNEIEEQQTVMNAIENVLDRIATQLFAETKLRYLLR